RPRRPGSRSRSRSSRSHRRAPRSCSSAASCSSASSGGWAPPRRWRSPRRPSPPRTAISCTRPRRCRSARTSACSSGATARCALPWPPTRSTTRPQSSRRASSCGCRPGRAGWHRSVSAWRWPAGRCGPRCGAPGRPPPPPPEPPGPPPQGLHPVLPIEHRARGPGGAMAAERFPVVLVDDGELDDVRGLLDELGLAFAHLRGGAIPKRIEPPRDPFLATLRRAALARRWPQSPDGCLRPVRIAFVDEDSPAARTALRKLGFAYLVRRPVHPVALRLLILRALYQGEERRSEVRVPVGVDVTLRTGLRRRDALLADLSRNGCRLVTDRALPAGARLTLHPPAALVGDGDPALGGRILRCERDARALADGGYQVAVRFESLRPAARQRLARLLGRRDLRIRPEPEPR